MALATYVLLRGLRKRLRFNVVDAHFAYPDGYAATLVGRWLKIPVSITLRGTEVPLSLTNRRQLIVKALARARRVFSVSESLKQHAVNLGCDKDKILVVGNGVDTEIFHPIPKALARARLELPRNARVLISVGGLTERKGFHRVIDCLPQLQQNFPELRLLIAGGPSAEGDWGEWLKKQVANLQLTDMVQFLGMLKPDELSVALSASDVFVLATSNEGWANVFLEAMACGLPVVTTTVGGNAEVVVNSELGTLVPFGDQRALILALEDALSRQWDHEAIINYAAENTWDARIKALVGEFRVLVG
jgi:glycosyltransferase involved in cell wall biosynthesis